ncbi:MAG: uncharacterized protein JWR62_3281 [Modestobacter sp.]|nr:uncharacterized protein [Modestobacter sp.]
MTRSLPTLAALLVLAGTASTGCTSTVSGQARPATGSTATDLPETSAALGDLLVTEVPSGLPRVPDDELQPPAGEKTVDDVAGYAQDAADQQEVLEEYGYRHGWERFWRGDEALTTVFVDQFSGPMGATSYADDLVRNDAEYYGGVPADGPTGLPEGCAEMSVDEPDPSLGLAGPVAFSWCPHGVFTVSVAAVAATPEAARAEVEAVTLDQLGRLPRG